MKFLCPLISFLLMFHFSYAQELLTSGKIEMKVTKVENAGLKGTMINGSMQTVYFNESYNRLSIYTMKGMVKMDIVNDKTSNETLMLTGGIMLGKKQIKVESQEKKPREYTITYDESDTKTILGYTCTKAILEKDKLKMEVYFTEQIDVTQTPLRQQFSGLRGFSLQYTIIDDEGVRITYTAQNIETNLSLADFDLPTDGYEEMTEAEARKMLRNAG